MARGKAAVAAAALAVLSCAPAVALAQDRAEDGGAKNPSIFRSIWSGLKRAADGPAPDAAAPGDAPPPATAETPAAPAQPPSLSAARWIGFTPALVAAKAMGPDAPEGAWIAGPFPEAGATAWVTDTLSGLTAEVRLVWREAAPGSLAELSAEAGRALGLAPGAIANVTIYLAR